MTIHEPTPADDFPVDEPNLSDEESKLVEEMGGFIPSNDLDKAVSDVVGTDADGSDDAGDDSDNGEEAGTQDIPSHEGDAVGGGDAVAHAVLAPDDTPVVTTPDPSLVDLNLLAEQVYGKRLSEEEASTILLLKRDLDQMNDWQRQAIAQIAQGQRPQFEQNPYQQQPVQSQQVPQQQPIQTPIPEFVDPDLAASMQPVIDRQQQLENELLVLRQQAQQQEVIRQQQEAQQLQGQVEQSISSWRQERTLSPEEWVVFNQKVVQSGLVGQLYAATGDVGRATKEALEHHYWTDPTFREREIAQAAANVRAQQAEQAKRTSKATALSGGGGSKPRSNPTTSKITQQQSNMAALADGLAEAMGMDNNQ